MTLDALIFSNSRNYRYTRHAIFWLAWILYYTCVSALLWRQEVGFFRGFVNSFIEVTVSTPLDMMFCYFVIYFLLPRFLFKGRYTIMVLLWIIASFAFFVLFELYLYYAVPFIRSLNGLPAPMHSKNILNNFFSLFSQINMEGCVAASIKLGKLWHIKQQQYELLKEEKTRNELKAEKAQLQPFFLVDILERAERLSEEKPLQMPVMIKKLKSLLMYALYENTMSRVAVAKEISLLKEYIELHKAAAEQPVNVTLTVTGDTEAHKIAPFIILPVTENAFKQLSLLQMQQRNLSILIDAAHGKFYMELTWNKPPDTSTLANSTNVILQNIHKKLNLVYPQSHDLKVRIEVEEVVVTLTINLKKAVTG